MSETHPNLIAWLDRELEPAEAVAVESHLQGCEECRGRVSAYESVSADFAASYKAANEPPAPAIPMRSAPRWTAYVVAAAAIAVIAFALLPRAQKHTTAETKTVAAVVTSEPAAPAPAAVTEPPQKHLTPAVKHRAAKKPTVGEPVAWAATQSAIQIAIPADAMFPPGAVPEGMAYIARLAPDGSLQEIRVQQ